MISAASSDRDPYGGLGAPYKRDYQLLPDGFTFKHPGVAGPPEKRTVDAPTIRASVSTDRKKTNARVVYTRVTPLDTHLVAGKSEGCVFVSRTMLAYTDTRTDPRRSSTGPEKRSLVAGLDAVNLRLSKGDASHATLDGNMYSPLDEWRRVPELREWPLDGVLVGLDNEVNASAALNVCVAGPCPVRNIFNEDVVLPLDCCYLMLIAERVGGGGLDAYNYRFRYVPCTSRTLAEPKELGQRMLSRKPALSEAQRAHAVGGWRLGRVMDSAAVAKVDQKTLTVDVRIEWVGWRALRAEFPDGKIGGELLRSYLAPVIDTCKLFYWPTAMPKNGIDRLDAPSKPLMNDWELGLKGGQTKNVHAIQDEAQRGCGPPKAGDRLSTSRKLLPPPPKDRASLLKIIEKNKKKRPKSARLKGTPYAVPNAVPRRPPVADDDGDDDEPMSDSDDGELQEDVSIKRRDRRESGSGAVLANDDDEYDAAEPGGAVDSDEVVPPVKRGKGSSAVVATDDDAVELDEDENSKSKLDLTTVRTTRRGSKRAAAGTDEDDEELNPDAGVQNDQAVVTFVRRGSGPATKTEADLPDTVPQSMLVFTTVEGGPLNVVVCYLTLWNALEKERASNNAPTGDRWVAEKPPPDFVALEPINIQKSAASVVEDDNLQLLCELAQETANTIMKRLDQNNLRWEVQQFLEESASSSKDANKPWWYEWIFMDLMLFFQAHSKIVGMMMRANRAWCKRKSETAGSTAETAGAGAGAGAERGADRVAARGALAAPAADHRAGWSAGTPSGRRRGQPEPRRRGHAEPDPSCDES